MSQTILKVENLSKQYRLGKIGTGTLSHDLNRWWHSVRGKEDPYLKIGEANDRSSKGSSEYVWALKDINFEVQKGEVLGIIGKNGAGKSTLLKILSRVTSPSTGSVKTKGRIASLLEVGTGFHPEMTGRENIFLNGAILGMTKREIASKIDEIIAFSGCERYIDTPVKRYSSGMTVRLAFAVAAHLEPEILVIDEVLAVGDAEFQKKAIGKMQDISKGEGRTVLFVSHNMAAVKSLCKTGIVLENGILTFKGTSEECVGYYLNDSGTHTSNLKHYNENYSKELFTLHSIGVKNQSKSFDDTLVENLAIELIVSIDFKIIPDNYHITYHLYNELGEALFSFYDFQGDAKLKMGTNQLICTIPANFFQSGNYSLALFIVKDKRTAVFVERDIFGFTVVDGERELGVYMGREPGYIRPQFKWSIQ